MYQLALHVTPPADATVVALNSAKAWPTGTAVNAAELAVNLAKQIGAFFKPTPKDVLAVSKGERT